MKKVLLSILSVAFLSVNAQIFINTNPNVNVEDNFNGSKTEEVKVSTTTTTVTTPTVTKTPVTTPVVTTPTVTKTTVTTPVVTTPTVTTPVVPTTTTTNYNTTTVATTSNYSKKASTVATEEVPPNAVPGKCYARCLVEDKFGYVNETVVDQPRIIKKVKLPALYKTVYDTIIITPKTTRTISVPAIYETIKEQVMATPATTKWVKGKADAGCLSANPADCQVMCLVEVPATYKMVDRKVLKNKAYNRTETTPQEFKIVSKEILVQAERFIDQETPATYKTIQKRVITEKGGYEVWREILCGDDLTTQRIIDIQKALKSKGYNPGPMDNVFGSLTKAALIQYQKDKGLPVGNLNLETLRSLGVN